MYPNLSNVKFGSISNEEKLIAAPICNKIIFPREQRMILGYRSANNDKYRDIMMFKSQTKATY